MEVVGALSQPWNSWATSQTFMDWWQLQRRFTCLKRRNTSLLVLGADIMSFFPHCFYFKFNFTTVTACTLNSAWQNIYGTTDVQSLTATSSTTWTMALRVRLQLLARPSRLCYAARRCYSNDHTVSDCTNTEKCLYVFNSFSFFLSTGCTWCN